MGREFPLGSHQGSSDRRPRSRPPLRQTAAAVLARKGRAIALKPLRAAARASCVRLREGGSGDHRRNDGPGGSGHFPRIPAPSFGGMIGCVVDPAFAWSKREIQRRFRPCLVTVGRVEQGDKRRLFSRWYRREEVLAGG